ncbi:MAG: signal peptidase I [Clostridiales bacterium]|jgi:signal peptidase I|nr:signal peptidase I [Clostridiales bacterium]
MNPVLEEKKAEIISWIKLIIFSVALALFINNFIIVNAMVPSPSMENTINMGDRLFAFRLSYVFSDPKRYDIIVFHFPDDETQLFVKRLIGLPGETVTVRNGKVYINDSETPLDDDFVKGAPNGDAGPFVVPENAYFFMGDNRNDSHDSRGWVNKFVYKEKMLGKVILRYFPPFKIF